MCYAQVYTNVEHMRTRANTHLICIFSFTSRTWQNSHVEALHANFYGKVKSRKMSLGKEDGKTRLSKIANVLQCDASPWKS